MINITNPSMAAITVTSAMNLKQPCAILTCSQVKEHQLWHTYRASTGVADFVLKFLSLYI